MYSTNVLLAFGFTLAATTNAAPTTRPLFTAICCHVDSSNSTGVANVTTGEFPSHKHTPDCEHNYNTTKGHGTEGNDHTTKVTGNPSLFPGFNASAYAHPHAVQAHNHTGDYCNHPSHHNTTGTDATYDEIIHPKMLNASVESSHNHTEYHCAHPSHHNGTSSTGYSYDKKSIIPRVDVTVCIGADCKNSKVVTANVNSAREVTDVEARNSKRMVKREDSEISYEDVARQMSGGGIAGGM